MELNEKDGHWRATLDLADGKIIVKLPLFLLFNLFKGIYHYQYKVVTKSWFEEEPEPALPDITNDETKSETNLYSIFRSLK